MTRENRYSTPRTYDPRPVTSETRADVVRLHGEGYGRNEICRELGYGHGTISKIAREEGLVFDTASSEMARRIEQANVAEIRTRVSKLFMLRAEEALTDMDAPTLIGSFGGTHNEWRERVLDTPPADVKRNLMTIAAIGAQRHAELERVGNSSGGATEGASLLEALGDGMLAAAESLRGEGFESPAIDDAI